MISSTDFDTDWTHIEQNLNPSINSYYSFGIRWKYALSMAYTPDYKTPEKTGKEIYYYLTVGGAIIKIEFSEEEHMVERSTQGLSPEAKLIDYALHDKHSEEMQKNIKFQVQMGVNGQPIHIDEIAWLNQALENSTIVERESP